MKLEQRDFRDIFTDPEVDDFFDMLFNNRKKLCVNKTPYNNKHYKIYYASKKEYRENRYGR